MSFFIMEKPIFSLNRDLQMLSYNTDKKLLISVSSSSDSKKKYISSRIWQHKTVKYTMYFLLRVQSPVHTVLMTKIVQVQSTVVFQSGKKTFPDEDSKNMGFEGFQA